MKEYKLISDIVIEVPDSIQLDTALLTNHILDAIIDIVEGYDGHVGGGITVELTDVSEDEVNYGTPS